MTELNRAQVVEVKRHLRARGLGVAGTRTELLKRLKAAESRAAAGMAGSSRACITRGVVLCRLHHEGRGLVKNERTAGTAGSCAKYGAWTGTRGGGRLRAAIL